MQGEWNTSAEHIALSVAIGQIIVEIAAHNQWNIDTYTIIKDAKRYGDAAIVQQRGASGTCKAGVGIGYQSCIEEQADRPSFEW